MIHTHTPYTAERWIRWERILLITLVIGRIVAFFKRYGSVIGFDTGGHLEMLSLLSWAHPDTDIHGSFYGYHPPLGFLIPRTLHLLFGFTPEISVQWTSFLAGLITFFFLRETLRYCRLLYRPSGMAFLYIAASMPIQVAVTTSINLDTIVLAMGSIVLCASVRIMWPASAFQDQHHPERALPLKFGMRDPEARAHFWRSAEAVCGATMAITVAALTKFSGVLLLAIPAFVAWSQPYGRGWWRRCFVGAVGCMAAIALAAPYYHGRYYAREGKYFPLNVEWGAQDSVASAIAQRQEDPVHFFTQLFMPSPVHAAEGITQRDEQMNRLSDMWRDFWVRSRATGDTTPRALSVGVFYMCIAPFLLLMGFINFLKRIRRNVLWIRFGWVLLSFSLVELAALIQFIYRVPYAGWVPSKGIYVLPMIWGLSYLIVSAFQDQRLLPRSLRCRVPAVQNLCMAAVLLFVAVNHSIPVY